MQPANIFSDLVHSADEPPEKFSEDKKGDSYSMNLTPVTLFNYRLWGLATHQSLSGEPEIWDIEPLAQAFKHDLQVHRAEINTKFARFAIRTHPELEDVLARLGVDMNRSKGKEVVPMPGLEVDEDGEEQLPPYDPGWGRSHEQNISGRMAEIHLKEGEPAPSYDAPSGKWGRNE